MITFICIYIYLAAIYIACNYRKLDIITTVSARALLWNLDGNHKSFIEEELKKAGIDRYEKSLQFGSLFMPILIPVLVIWILSKYGRI